MCRQEEQELERFINWASLPGVYVHSTCCYYCGDEGECPKDSPCYPNRAKAVERLKELKMTQPATPVPTNDQSSNVGPSDGLPDEFTDNADPKGDACCYQGGRNE